MLTKYRPANSILFGANDIDESLNYLSSNERVLTAQ